MYLCQNAGAREILAFVNGKPVGMFNQYEQFVSGRHDNILLTNSATPGEQFQIDLECYAWHYEPGLTCYDNLGKDYAKDEEFIKTFENISICTKNSEIYDFICDLKIAIEISRYDRNDFLKAKAINLLEAISPMLCFSLTLTILKRLCKAFARQTICLANYLKEKAMQ